MRKREGGGTPWEYGKPEQGGYEFCSFLFICPKTTQFIPFHFYMKRAIKGTTWEEDTEEKI
jgi:hypothetical protein